ncbi:NAD-binding protein, partial [Streptomyces sp. NPDC002285]
MGDTFGIMQTLAARRPKSAVVIGAGHIGLEMAEALTTRGLRPCPMWCSVVGPVMGRGTWSWIVPDGLWEIA